MSEPSPRSKARLMGVFEALEGATSAYGQVVVLGKLVVGGSAALTAANILGRERLFWVGFVSSVLGVAFHVAWVALFYELFKPVHRTLSLTAAFFGLVTCGMQAVAALLYLGPMLVLKGGPSLSALPADQAQALAVVLLKLNGHAFNVDLVFFGFWCVLAGFLIIRSTFLPRILGILLITFILPSLGRSLFPFVAGASALAEIQLQFWLIVFGVNPERWREQAAAAKAA
jgi:hypothetical protein